MNFDKLIKVLLALALASLAAHAADKKPATAAAPAPKAARLVEMKVTDKGFEPASISVKKGEAIKLRVTRTTAETCATELILPDYKIDKELPLNTAVDIEFTPSKSGSFRYGCAMGMMVAGVLVVE